MDSPEAERPREGFAEEVIARARSNGRDSSMRFAAEAFLESSIEPRYSYNFSWLGRPIIQYPQDIIAMQELIWAVKPDLIIETGIAHGGSLVFSASMLAINAACGGPPDARVLGMDIEIRPGNRQAIEAHPMFSRISMIEGSSIDPGVIEQVRTAARSANRVLVSLDSSHTHAHVLAELNAYAPLTTPGSYCVVFDTIIEDLPATAFPDREWGKGNNPRTAVREYLNTHPEFEVDELIDNRLLISVAPGGYLKRVR